MSRLVLLPVTGGTTGVATAERISGIVACELNANPVAESIQKVFLTNPGAGYTLAPAVRFAGDGVGAAATSIIGDGVIGIVTITGGGSGYTTATAPAVTFSGSATVSAAATVRVSSAGTISHLYITNAGLGYTEAPTITIAAPNQTGVGTFQKNEIVAGSSSGTTARVLNWVADGGSLEIYRADGDFVVGEQIVGAGLLPQVTNLLLLPSQKLDSWQMKKLRVKQMPLSILLREIHSVCPEP